MKNVKNNKIDSTEQEFDYTRTSEEYATIYARKSTLKESVSY